jgi:hypothetical protein
MISSKSASAGERQDGTFTVTNTRNGFSKTYKTAAKAD